MQIGAYQVIRLIRNGSNSRIFQARHVASGDIVVIKLYLLDQLDHIKVRQFTAEVEALERIKLHPNVIRMIQFERNAEIMTDSGNLRKACFIVLEFVQGGDLFDVIQRNGKFDEATCRVMFRQIIAAIKECHLKNIAHRDIKPDNILIDGDRVVLSDFGLSVISENGILRNVVGSPGYIAPEIHLKGNYDFKIDVFSAGVVLFIMFAGFPPFQVATTRDWWFNRIIQGRLDLFWEAHERFGKLGFSDELKALIAGMLHQNPKDRMNLIDVENSKWYRNADIPKNAVIVDNNLHAETIEENTKISEPVTTQIIDQAEITIETTEQKSQDGMELQSEQTGGRVLRPRTKRTITENTSLNKRKKDKE
jgi:serine/threonine protein kinase